MEPLLLKLNLRLLVHGLLRFGCHRLFLLGKQQGVVIDRAGSNAEHGEEPEETRPLFALGPLAWRRRASSHDAAGGPCERRSSRGGGQGPVSPNKTSAGFHG